MTAIDPERSLDPTKAEIEKRDRERRVNGFQDLVRAVMESPLKQGKLIEIAKDNKIPIKDLKGANVSVQTAIILGQAASAVGGNVKSAEWMCKYAGYEPAKETKVEFESVTFVDDIPAVNNAIATAVAKVVKDAADD